MHYALIRNNIIEQVIVCDSETYIQRISPQWDYVVRVDNLNPEPCLGSTYNPDNQTFVAPE